MEIANPVTETDSESLTVAAKLDFGFAFNDTNFSDRLLRIEISRDSPASKPDGDGDGEGSVTIANSARKRKQKRRREEIDKENSAKVKNINISSPILAAHSPFFYKLFSNGMKESEQRHATLQIHASEEDALMDVLNFMYHHTLKTTTFTGLLDVLIAADKFQVASCMIYCTQLLKKFPMTLDLALLCLDLPSSVSMADAVRPLIDSAKEFLALRFKNITEYEDEVMKLPLAGMEAVLSSNELHVTAEDNVYDLALRWARNHYPNLEERREVLSTRLCPLIRSPHMTFGKLWEVLSCCDLEPKLLIELVLHAILFKFVPPSLQRKLITAMEKEANTFHLRCIERAYLFRPVKVVEFEHPCKQCIVYWDLKKDECNEESFLVSEGSVGGKGFFLGLLRKRGYFSLSIAMQERIEVALEVAVRQIPGHEFVSKYRGIYKFNEGRVIGHNLFSMPSASFIAEDNEFFINGVLHLRFQVTLIMQ